MTKVNPPLLCIDLICYHLTYTFQCDSITFIHQINLNRGILFFFYVPKRSKKIHCNGQTVENLFQQLNQFSTNFEVQSNGFYVFFFINDHTIRDTNSIETNLTLELENIKKKISVMFTERGI